MTQKRKGSRLITVNGTKYSWFRGKTVTEVRNLDTRKTERVPNETLDKTVNVVVMCECCEEPVYHDGVLVTVPKASLTPSRVRDFIVSTRF